MTARIARPSAASLLLVLTGCAAFQPRPDLPAEALVAVAPSPPAPLAPATDLVLANPLACLEAATPGNGGVLALAVLCIPVLAAVDLVALPVVSVIRHGEERDLDALAAGCPLSDPGAHAAEILLDGLAANHGLARPGEPGSETFAAPTLWLEVTTERFCRSGSITWRGRARLFDSSGRAHWSDTCQVDSAKRDVPAILEGCEASRAEVAALAATCARRWLDRLARATAPPRPEAPGAATDHTARE